MSKLASRVNKALTNKRSLVRLQRPNIADLLVVGCMCISKNWRRHTSRVATRLASNDELLAPQNEATVAAVTVTSVWIFIWIVHITQFTNVYRWQPSSVFIIQLWRYTGCNQVVFVQVGWMPRWLTSSASYSSVYWNGRSQWSAATSNF
jgi:hypothetical protein